MTSVIIQCGRCGRRNRVPAAASGHPRCGNCTAPLPWIVNAGDRDFADVAEKASRYVLVDLWAPWCGPCRMVSPALELSNRFDIKAVPTLLILHQGEVIARQAGAAPARVLGEWVDSAIARTPTSTSDSGGHR